MKYIAAYALMILSPQPQEANDLTHRHLGYCRAGLHHLSSITQHIRTLARWTVEPKPVAKLEVT